MHTTRFLLLWPWPWSNDLDIRACPEDFEDEDKKNKTLDNELGEFVQSSITQPRIIEFFCPSTPVVDSKPELELVTCFGRSFALLYGGGVKTYEIWLQLTTNRIRGVVFETEQKSNLWVMSAYDEPVVWCRSVHTARRTTADKLAGWETYCSISLKFGTWCIRGPRRLQNCWFVG